MSDAYDNAQADKQMSQRINKIFKDPNKHQFCSEFELDEYEDRCGIRGGKIRGRKTICTYCGAKKHLHVQVTEQY